MLVYRAFYPFFATSLFNSVKQKHECEILSYDIKITSKEHIWREKDLYLRFCIYVHNVHKVVMDVISQCY